MQQLFQDGAVVLFLDAFLKKASVGVVSMAIPFPHLRTSVLRSRIL